MSLILATTLVFALLAAPEGSAAGRIQSEQLASLSYEQIHKLAVEQQVADYPRTKPIKSLQSRHGQLLDGTWNFCLDNQASGFELKWFAGELGERKCGRDQFFQMPVPAAFNEIPSDRRVRDYIGWVWYQRAFYLDLEVENKLKFLHFDNVNYLAAVWISRKRPGAGDDSFRFLGMHAGGFLPFQFALNQTDEFFFSTSGPFHLTLAVSNRLTQDTIPSGSMVDFSEQVGYKFEKFLPDFDFFHFAGIMGSVRLVYLPEVHLSRVEAVELIDSGEDSINWEAEVCLANRQLILERNASLVHLEKIIGQEGELYDPFNSKWDDNNWHIYPEHLLDDCLTISFKTFKPSNDFEDSSCRVFTPSKTLRVQLVIRAGDGRKSLLWADAFELKLNWKSERRKQFSESLKVGGSRFRLQGFGLHQEQLFAGRALSGATLFKDIYLLKQMGANVVRTSHYPYSEAFLEACDQADILVIAECQAVGLRSFGKLKLLLHKQLLLEMMERDHRHSSIIAWSVANEPESQLNESRGYFEELLGYARKELARFTVEVGRPLTAALAQSHRDDQVGHTLDLLMINRYYGWYDWPGVLEAIRRPLVESLLGWSRKYPLARGLLVSEFGADALAGIHRQSPGELYSEEFQMNLLLEYEKVFDELANNRSGEIKFLGSMIWNFADFSTHESLARVAGNRKGLFTREREPKLAVDAIRALYWARNGPGNCTCSSREVARRVPAEGGQFGAHARPG